MNLSVGLSEVISIRNINGRLKFLGGFLFLAASHGLLPGNRLHLSVPFLGGCLPKSLQLASFDIGRENLSLFFFSLSLSFLCSQGTLSGIDSEVNTDLNVFQEIFSRTPSNFLRTRKKLVCPGKTKSKSINAKMISGLESCSPKVLIARVAKPMFLDHADNLYLPTLILQLYIMHPRTKKSFL